MWEKLRQGKNFKWEEFHMGRSLSGRITVVEDFRVGGFPCSRIFVWEE